MDEFDPDLLLPHKDNRRKVRVVQNGNPTEMKSCILKKHINFDELAEIICEKMEISRRGATKIRIFKTGGVEVFNEDVQYIKEGDILFVSFGDEFDDSSNFAVFKMKECLGQGGYGKVYEAKNRLTKQKVAIKMIDTSRIKNAKDTEMTYKELIALKNLNHRCILKVYNCFTLQKERQIALVLEYLEGGDLRQYMQAKKIIPEKEAQKLFQQLFMAVQYCHKENIIHRDLKLENIMFEDKEHEKLKVVDFGICGRQSMVNIDFTTAGSIRYLAPEVITSHAPANPSIDVWAMGCILFWMVTGGSPFPQNSKERVQENIVKGRWSFTEQNKQNLSKSVQKLISGMLEVNIKKRIKTTDIAECNWMKFSLEEILEEEQRQKEILEESNAPYNNQEYNDNNSDELKNKQNTPNNLSIQPKNFFSGSPATKSQYLTPQPQKKSINPFNQGSPLNSNLKRNSLQNTSSDQKVENKLQQIKSLKGNQPNKDLNFEPSYFQKIAFPNELQNNSAINLGQSQIQQQSQPKSSLFKNASFLNPSNNSNNSKPKPKQGQN